MDYQHARCLFCVTGSEAYVAEKINGMGQARAMMPMRTKRYKAAGVWQEEQKLLFPSYVFLYSQPDFDLTTLRRVDKIVRILQNKNPGYGILTGQDAQFAKTLWDLEGKIGVMKAIQIGERVEIVDGVFKSLKGRVIGMDRRKMAARIELNVVGSISHVWLSYEIINTVNEHDYESIERLESPINTEPKEEK